MRLKSKFAFWIIFGSVKGKVIVASPQKGQVVVLRFMDEDGIPVLQRSIVIPQNSEYELPAIVGKHYVAAYIDVYGDGQYQAEEHGNYYGEPTPVEIMGKSEVSIHR